MHIHMNMNIHIHIHIHIRIRIHTHAHTHVQVEHLDRIRGAGHDGLSAERRQRMSYRRARDTVVKALFDRVLGSLTDDLSESRAAVAMGNLCDGELEYARVR